MANVSELLQDNTDFVIDSNIPRQKALFSQSQVQTQDTFGFKWAKRDTYESVQVQDRIKDWLLERYKIPGQDVKTFLTGKKVLDAGCGSAVTAMLLFEESLNACDYLGVDISNAVDVAEQRFREKGLRGQFLQSSLMDIPEALGNFDVIFSEGVLHHTDSTEQAIKHLAKRLNPGGIFMFYVYRKKGPVREFSDDYIRNRLAALNNEEAWKALESLTKIGKTLGELNIEIEIEDPIDVLEIPAGKINLQRLFYWHIFKAYYRPDWTLDEMNHVNFDWYRPSNCHRHTVEEITAWLDESALNILHLDVQEAGITAVARKDI